MSKPSRQRIIEDHAANLVKSSRDRAAREIARDGEARTRPMTPREARAEAERVARYRDRNNTR